MKLTLIRHAPTVANREKAFAGSSESPITEDGLIQIRKLAGELQFEKYQQYIASPLERARQTASILFADAEILIDDRLVERGLGEWEGKKVSDLKQLHPHAFLSSGKLNPLYTPPGGERIDGVAERLLAFLREKIDANIESVVAVTHNAAIRTFRAIIENLTLEEAFLVSEKNLQVRTYEIEPQFMEHVSKRYAQILGT